MRNAFADEITRLGAVDKRVTLLSGDIGNKLFDKFKDNNSDRFFNCGVAEANMMGMAAGLALNGLRPVVYTITPFTTTRFYEQIRVDVCYHRAPVVIVGTGAGLSYVDLGPTHHSCEDIAMLRVLPEMTVLCPCDANELRAALRAALKHDGPVYMRIGKKGEPVIYKSPPDFEIGRAITVREGSDICLISTGNVMRLALDVADQLGIIGIACPDEAPLLAFVSLVGPALAMGNRVVVLPGEACPLTATDLYQVVETSDVPGGVLNIVTGERGALLPALAKHDDVDAVWCFGNAVDSTLVERESIGNLKRTFVDHGRQFEYSNPGIGLFTYCVTAAIKGSTHRDIRSLLRERVMRQVGVPDAEWSIGYGQTFTVHGLPLVASCGGGTASSGRYR